MKYIQPLNEPANSSYSNGNPDTGTEGSIIPAQALEAPQREIVNVIAQAARQNSDTNARNLSQGSAIEGPLATDTTQLYKAIRQLACPAGQVMAWAGTINNTPKGFLVCNGEQYHRRDYPDLFAAVGTMHDTHDRPYLFRVPNLQDKFVLGRTAHREAGTTGGAFRTDGHVLTVAEMPSHHHNLWGSTGGHSNSYNYSLKSASYLQGNASHEDHYVSNFGYDERSTGSHANNWISNTGNNRSHKHNNTPPYYSMIYIIRT